VKEKIVVLIILVSSCGKTHLASFKEAKKHFSDQEYSKSLKEVTDCLSDNPDFIDGYLLRAKVNLHLFDTIKAISDYTFVFTNLDHRNTYSFYELSLIHSDSKNFTQALSNIHKAIHTKGSALIWTEKETNPNYAPVYDVPMVKLRFQRGLIYFELKNYERALNDFDFCSRSIYRMKDVNYFRGNCLIELGYPDAAYEAYRIASDWNSVKADSVLKLFHY
jgi:tetratricopeptide (TPR) repeat protein